MLHNIPLRKSKKKACKSGPSEPVVQYFSTHQVVHDVNEDVVVGVKQLREVEQHLFQNVAVAPFQVRQLVKKVQKCFKTLITTVDC